MSASLNDTHSFTLKTPPDFSFRQCLAYLARSPEECMYAVADGHVDKLFEYGGTLYVVRVSEGDGSLNVTFLNETPSVDVQTSVLNDITDWFDLKRDVTPFYRIAEGDPLLAKTLARHKGLRVVGITDLFESICWAIIGQQINLPFAYRLKRRLVEAFGRSLEWNGVRFWIFPSPETVAALTPEQLTPMQFSGKKAEYLIEAAKQTMNGTINKNRLLALNDFDAAVERLTQIRGIGKWTAHYALMRCLRDPRAFPIDDVGLHNAIKKLLQLDRKPAIAEIRELARGWTGWEAYATFYLWRCLED